VSLSFEYKVDLYTSGSSPVCDMPDCVTYSIVSGKRVCNSCRASATYLVIDSYPLRTYTPKAVYLNNGQCVSDCSKLEGYPNMVNDDATGTCKCADGFIYDANDKKCHTC